MITYIKIEGYKSIRQLEIELTPINVLIGSNGSGKSNFLSFFKLLRAIFNRQLQHFVLEETVDDLLYFGRKNTEYLNGKVIFSDGGNSNHAYLFRLSPTKDDTLFIELEGSGYQVTKDNDHDGYKYENSLRESAVPSIKRTRDAYLAEYLAGIQMYHFHDTSHTSWLRKASEIEDNKALKSDGRNLAAFLYKLKQGQPIIYSRILKTVQSVAPFIYDFILEPSETKGRENTIELRWIDRNDLNSNFSARHFSDGTLRFIALATVLLQPQPPSVVIIDEPELGLHPLAISKLAGMVRSASQSTQIIISTQSVTLVDCFGADEVIAVDRDEKEKQSIFKRLESEMLQIWLEEHSLGDLWERNIINAAQPFMK